MTDSELAWLAGLLEGEGYFGVSRYRKKSGVYEYPLIRLAMVDRDVVEKAAKLIGCSVMRRFPPSYERAGNHQVQWIFEVTCRRASELLKLLRPLLGERRQARVDELLAL